MNRRLANSFEAWHSNGKALRRKLLLVRNVIVRWMHRSLSHVIDNWMLHAKERKKRRQICLKIIRRWTHQVSACYLSLKMYTQRCTYLNVP